MVDALRAEEVLMLDVKMQILRGYHGGGLLSSLLV